MGSFLGSLTSNWPMDEASGHLIDSIGSFDSATILGAPTYNEPTVTIDGVDDAFFWPFGVSSAQFIDVTQDFSLFLYWEVDNQYPGVQRLFFRPENFNATRQGPLFAWLDNTSQKVITARSHNGAGTAQVNMTLPRLLNVGEQAVLIMSYEVSSKTVNAVFQTDQGIDLNGSAVGTNPIGWTSGERYTLGWSNSVFTNMTLNRMGAVNGTYYSISDLQDTAQDVLFPGGSAPTFRNPSKHGIIREPIWNRGKKRFIRD